jgi:putative CocE/NonD family hydrolase
MALTEPKQEEWTHEKELYVRMRDGVHLSTDVILPKQASGKLATILVRTPYDKDRGEGFGRGKWKEFFLRQGYAVVLQNERGFFLSEGTFHNYLAGASTDGVDTLDWIVEQPWSNGKVGTIGCSSSSEQQWPMAANNHPAHAAMIPMASGTAIGDIPGNDTRGCIYRGGVPMLSTWVMWYGRAGVTERPGVPANSTQEQRIRLRSFYALGTRQGFVPDTVAKLRHLPSGEILHNDGGPLTPFDRYITWSPADPGWDEVEQLGAGDEPRVASLHINTWHDIGIGETVRVFEYLQNLGAPNQFLVVGAGPHCVLSTDPPSPLTLADAKEMIEGMGWADLTNIKELNMAKLKFGDLEAGDNRYGGVDHGYANLCLAWFDHFLKGEANDITEMPKVQLFVMNRGWISSDAWPLKETVDTPYHLAPTDGDPTTLTGSLSTDGPSGEGADSYVYDPNDPTPSLGGGCCDYAAALDQRPISARQDVLVYSTPPLEQPVTVVGPIKVILHVSTSAKDTDFMVRLVDVHPDRMAINLSDDAFRLRYREGYDNKVLSEAGDVYEITLGTMVTANHFAEGHCIRIEISSACFPLYERNLNTGGNNHDESEGVIAVNTVHYGVTHPSRVVLPVLGA